MLSGIAFMVITCTGYLMSLWRGPFWGLLVYVNIYFITPRDQWWSAYIPQLRWSLISAIVLMISLVLHRDKISKHKLRSTYWMFAFFTYTFFITNTNAVHPENADRYTMILLTYCITVFIFIKTLSKFQYIRVLLLIFIGLAANLSYKAYFYGKRIDLRLEGIGPRDAHGSNEFGLLLISIVPLTLPFLLRGKWYERAICIIALPFILNAFILCNSRGAFLSIIASIIYVFFLVANNKVKKYLFIAALCVVPAMYYLSDQHFISRINTLWGVDSSSEESINELTTGRWLIFKYGLEMAKDNPKGVGPGGFRELSRFYMPKEMLSFGHTYEYGVRAAHNSYLQVLVEQGYIGLIIYLIIFFYTLYLLMASVKKIKKMGSTGTFIDLYLIGLNISFTCTLMGGMIGANVYYEFLWWQIALSVATYSFIEMMDKHTVHDLNNLPHINKAS